MSISKITPFEAYRIFNSIKLHFKAQNDSYSAVEFNYKVKTSTPASFERCNYKYTFVKLVKKYPDRQTLIDFYVANSVHTMGELFAINLVDSESDQKYLKWLKVRDSLSYTYTQDIQKLSDYCSEHKLRFDHLFSAGSRGKPYPPVIELFNQGEIHLETVVILDILTNFMKRADKLITDTILWPTISCKLRKYRAFMNVDQKKMKEITLLMFTNQTA